MQHAGDSGDSDLFSKATSFLQQNKSSIQNGGIDEQAAVQAHQAVTQGGSGQQHDADSLGMAAGVNALKMFTSGGSSGGSSGGIGSLLGGLVGGQGAPSGGGQNAFIGLAMAQASKMFDQQSGQGNVAGGVSKQDAITKAGEYAMKMYMQNQGGGSGGMGGLLSMASKFM